VLLICALFSLPVRAADEEPVHIGEKEGVVEVLGYVSGNGVMAREKPDTNSRVVSRLIAGSKVIVLAKKDNWYKVRLYNRKEAFVRKELVEFRYELKDEHITKSDIEKKFMVDIKNIAEQFNQMVKDSMFSRKNDIVPSIDILDGKKKNGTAVVDVLYCAVDGTGKAVPSEKENPLGGIMKQFVEIVLMKMMLSEAEEYKIVFRVPIFDNGRITGYEDSAEFSVFRGEANLNELRSGDRKIWEFIKSTVPADKFFSNYPH
jgi:hypothetical protein